MDRYLLSSIVFRIHRFLRISNRLPLHFVQGNKIHISNCESKFDVYNLSVPLIKEDEKSDAVKRQILCGFFSLFALFYANNRSK